VRGIGLLGDTGADEQTKCYFGFDVQLEYSACIMMVCLMDAWLKPMPTGEATGVNESWMGECSAAGWLAGG
jgi:hypothetical protein